MWYKQEHQKCQIRLQNVSNVKQAVESIPGGALTETVLTPANPNRLKRCLNLETHSHGITSKMCNTEWYWGDRCSEAKTSCCITLLGELSEHWIKIICWNLVGSPVGIQLRQGLPIFVNLLVANISTVKKRGLQIPLQNMPLCWEGQTYADPGQTGKDAVNSLFQ